MNSKILSLFILSLLLWLDNECTGQTATCNYKKLSHDSEGSTQLYSCDLSYDNIFADIKITSLKKKGSQFFKSNSDVKFLTTLNNSKLKTFPLIFCEKFANLLIISLQKAEIEEFDAYSLKLCTNLKQLHINFNKIKELPQYLLEKNSKLLGFRVGNNQITTLPENFFMNQNNLEKLDLHENQINFLPSSTFRQIENLQELYLNDNKLESIDLLWFMGLRKLKWLKLDGNQISEAPSKCFSQLRNLERLFLNHNRIKTLNSDSFDGLQNLQVLGLDHNEITELPIGVFTQLKNLENLSLNHNKLTTIQSYSFGIHNRLTVIWLQHNKINAIDEQCIDNTAVAYLYMDNNICNQHFVVNRNEIKSILQKCFDNYRPRLAFASRQMGSCGKGIAVQGTIIGGTEIKRNSFPWIAALITTGKKYFCGGTLVSDRKVVTAAHCMVPLARDITVLLGVHDLSETIEIGRIPFAVQSIHVHPDWNPRTDTYDADIAVMVLESEVTFSKYIQPICLMDSGSTLASITEGVVVGYGKDEDPNTLSINIAKFIKMPIHKNEYCFLKNYELTRFSSTRTFCGGSGNGTGVCKGDSGGGFVVAEKNTYYLRGIVSASLYNLNYECDVDSYSIFTNVLHFNDWINEVSIEPIF